MQLLKYSTGWIIVGLTLGVLVNTGCSTTKKIPASSTTDIAPIEFDAQKWIQQELTYNTLSAKGDIHITNNKVDQGASLNLRMKADTDIWASIVGMGIMEIARAKITPDSIWAVVRLGKKAVRMHYEEGAKLIKFPAEFKAIQNVFNGTALAPHASIKNSQQENGIWIITSEAENAFQELHYHKEGILHQQIIRYPKENFECTLFYSDYRPLDDKQPFAFKRKMEITHNNEKTIIQIDFSKVELNVPVEMKITIPDAYELIKP